MALSAKNDALAKEKAALKEKLAKIEAKEKAENEKRIIAVGRAVLDEAVDDAEFQHRLSMILDRRITKKRERSLLGLADKSAGF